MRAPLLTVTDLQVSFGAGASKRVAVDGVSLTVGERQTVALVGESGSGKSLTSLALLKLPPPGSHMSATAIRFADIDLAGLSDRDLGSIRGKRIATVFQNPSAALNPVLTICHQIVEVLHRHCRLRGKAARARALELLEMVEVVDPSRCLKQYPHQLSGGMRQRAMIASALAGGPDLLIADEPTTALDVTLQAQIMDLLQRLQAELGMAMLLISHDLGVVAQTADVVYVMYAGRGVETAEVRTLFRRPEHPYTQALLRTVKDLGSRDITELSPIPGSPPTLATVRVGCPFAPRCALVFDRCRTETPPLRTINPGQQAACHLAGSQVDGSARS
ncbi:MAG: ABC transporter ATP-binding protein [Mycobacteriales bacterium]